MNLFALLFGSMLVYNYILSRFLGLCPFMGVSKKLDSAVGMGLAVMFVMTIADIISYYVYQLLVVLHLEYLEIIAFIIVIAALVQLVEMIVKKSNPALYDSLGIYLPLITTNCAILGSALLLVQNHYDLIQSIVFAIGSSAGFTLALVIFAGIREKLEFADIPEPFKGTSSALLAASMLSMAFMAFSGMIKM